MNKELQAIIEDGRKLNALMAAHEHTYLDCEGKDDFEFQENRTYFFYAVWDAVKKLQADIDQIKHGTRSESEEMR